MKKQLFVLCIIQLFACLVAAAEINFILEEIPDMQGDAVVRNAGIYKLGWNAGADINVTVNGVLFANAGTVASGSITGTDTDPVTITFAADGNVFSGADAADRYGPALEDVMDTILYSNKYTDGAAYIDLTFSGLTVGHAYRIQFLMDQSTANDRNMHIVQGDNDSGVFSLGANVGHGISVLATFIADDSSMDFSLDPSVAVSRSVLNGVAVYNVPVPKYPVRLLSPNDAGVNVPVPSEPTLKWLSGTDPEIIQHVLYFSTNENWVNTALPADSGALIVDAEVETYQHFKALSYDATYFWRVDEVKGNINNPSNVEAGPVWNFTTESEPLPPCAGLRFDGDIDGDCFVDLKDILLLAQDWMLTSVVSDADINEDTNVDYADFAFIGRDWLSEVEKPNMLFIHAHPDDEGIFGGGVLPYYAQAKDMQVTAILTTSRNPDGSYPVSRDSANRIQMLHNAMDVYAGQSIGSGTFNELGYYITGNITLVETGLVATSCCDPDPLRTWSDLDDGKAWGVASFVTEITPGYGNYEGFSDGRLAGAWIIAREIRRCQPEVVVSVHDLEGEYGHENHTASAIALIEAYDLAADISMDIDGLDPWQVSKLYIRGGVNDNRDSIIWDGFTSDGGINPLFHGYMEDPVINGESARRIADRGVDQHVSEGGTDVSTVFRTGERYDTHHSEWWTLYRSTVGPDSTSTFTIPGDTTNSTYDGWGFGDFLENIVLIN